MLNINNYVLGDMFYHKPTQSVYILTHGGSLLDIGPVVPGIQDVYFLKTHTHFELIKDGLTHIGNIGKLVSSLHHILMEV